ncbi:ABC transporter substrate-binding protein [Natronorubrum halophilum]|uniref:ABC transporter substrate-binding protein n=1 Tax=Natronorubrum halophilum TaxID=1702106 RepID=UPI0010C1E450|nr:ABC transporter substrate-binding protein [Natronorubrum halophilum]
MQDGNHSLDRRTLLQRTGAATSIAGLAAIAGCLDDPSSGDDDIDELTITLSQFPDTIDPLNYITGDYFNVYDHVYEPLFDFEPGEGIFSRVVDDWEVQEGEGATELYLRDDVVFHNGDDLTAEDVAWTIERTVDPEIGVVSDIGSYGLGSIEGAQALDDTTVSVEYGAAPGLAEFEFGNYARAVNMEWAIDNYDADQEGQAISGADPEDFNGTGPYEVVDFTSGEEIVLERFDDYWGEEPPFETVTFNANKESNGRVNALRTDETDLTINILPENVSTVNDADDIEIRRVTSFRNIFCPMKNTVEPFDSQEFRQAMNYAVDNERIVNSALSGYGEARGQPVAPGINGFNDEIEPYEQDVGMAESLVEDSGYGGVEIELTVPQGRYLNDVQVGEMVADQIDQLDNVSCEANVVEFGIVSDANSAGVDPDSFDIPFYLIGWGTITGDTDYGTQGFFTIPGNEARTFDDEELSDAILESQQTEDPDERRQQLEEVNQLAHEKAPFLFLHTQESIYGVREAIQWDPREDESVHIWEMET